MDGTLRLAVWSGPRNISTAMMRSWGARADTVVVDEPFYARYLARTGAAHPGRDEVIGAGETDAARIVASLTGPCPRAVFYQKHMAHHILPGDDRSWLSAVTSAFLIREPAEMIASFVRVVANPTPRDLGLPQQVEMFERERSRTGRVPTVVDAREVLEDPRGVLGAWCERLGVAFDERMLSWEAGPRPTDGVWGKHWYGAVNRSTGFEAWREREVEIPRSLAGVVEECRGLYARLHAHRVRA